MHKWGRFIALYQKPDIRERRLYLTFDDGPNPYATPGILDVLDEFSVKAAFFVVGSNIEKFPEIVQEIHSRGHILGNHSFSHSMFFGFYAPQEQNRQIQKVEDLLAGIGIRPCRYFRPPNAICTRGLLSVLPQYTIVGVNHWCGDNMLFSPQLVVAKVMDSVKNRGGGILVLHDGVHFLICRSRKILPKALRIVIPEFLSQGYIFLSLDEAKDSNVLLAPNFM